MDFGMGGGTSRRDEAESEVMADADDGGSDIDDDDDDGDDAIDADGDGDSNPLAATPGLNDAELLWGPPGAPSRSIC